MHKLLREAYKAQKMTQGSTQKRDEAGHFLRKDQNGPFGNCENTAQKIASDFKVGEQTVKRAEHFLDGLNEAERVSPGIKESILTGEVEATERPGRLFPGLFFLFCKSVKVICAFTVIASKIYPYPVAEFSLCYFHVFATTIRALQHLIFVKIFKRNICPCTHGPTAFLPISASTVSTIN